jgi:hypothetical protein
MRRVAGIGLCLLMGACGPGTKELRQSVLATPRHTIAFMPFSIAPGQRDVRRRAEDQLRSHLADLGFDLVDRPEEAGRSVFGPATAPPSMQEVRSYGSRCGTDLVLVGRVERAAERPPRATTLRTVRRIRRDGTVDERVTARETPPAPRPRFETKLKLIDVGRGKAVWASRPLSSPPEWTLDQAVDYEMETQSLELAKAFVRWRG